MVAAVGDLGRTRRKSPRLKFVFTEHGCGITYNGGGASYLGSRKRDNVDLILVPNPQSKALQDEATPHIEIVSLGSSPRLDPWAPGQPAQVAYERSDPPNLALSWHWACKVNPETQTALRWYRNDFGRLLGQPWHVLGHGHPRAWATLRVIYDHWEIEKVRTFDEVLARADIYSADNSSTIYEFAATGRPVVVVNCPRYRRDVHHGLRFWDYIPGIQVDTAEEWADAIAEAIEDPPHLRALRQEAVDYVYPQHDGNATGRAVEAVVQALDRAEPEQILYSTPTDEYVVRDERGLVVARYLVHYEAKTHAKKIGGTFDVESTSKILGRR
jgi:hypothetical protein